MKVFSAENTQISASEVKVAIDSTKPTAAPGCCRWTIEDLKLLNIEH